MLDGASSEVRKGYGPYSPQELDRITAWLLSEKIEFEIEADRQSEKEAMMNDSFNVVSKAEFRTSVYLGQIFYVYLIDCNYTQMVNFEKKFTSQSEVLRRPEQAEPTGTYDVGAQAEKHRQRVRLQTRVALVVLGLWIFFLIYRVVKEHLSGS